MADFEGTAIIYCEGAFGTTNGKTAHGLMRKSLRYEIISVIDSKNAGKDAGLLLDQKKNNIPIHASIDEAISYAHDKKKQVTHFIIGLAPDGGRLPVQARSDVLLALQHGLHIVSGLHDFLSDDNEFIRIAKAKQVTILDIRKTPPHNKLHFFSGKIEEVDSLIIALLGTDSAVGKRTTGWVLYDDLIKQGYSVELIGTGQTAWLQGAKYSIILDSLINDFVSGEIEHAIWSAWKDKKPDIILIEGQGSLLNPAYPGGFEILAAGRPDVIVLQHAPGRKEYDGFPGYPIHPILKQIEALECISGKPVIALTINHENISKDKIIDDCRRLTSETNLPCVDVLMEGSYKVIAALQPFLKPIKLV